MASSQRISYFSHIDTVLLALYRASILKISRLRLVPSISSLKPRKRADESVEQNENNVYATALAVVLAVILAVIFKRLLGGKRVALSVFLAQKLKNKHYERIIQR